MQRSLHFKQEDDGRTPFYLLRMECGPDGGREGGKEKGAFACATNESFSRMFRPALALVDDVVAYRAVASLVFAR